MERTKEKSCCCGAGGARMSMEEKLGGRINVTRTEEALATGAERIAIGCRSAAYMISNGLTAKRSEGCRRGRRGRRRRADAARCGASRPGGLGRVRGRVRCRRGRVRVCGVCRSSPVLLRLPVPVPLAPRPMRVLLPRLLMLPRERRRQRGLRHPPTRATRGTRGPKAPAAAHTTPADTPAAKADPWDEPAAPTAQTKPADAPAAEGPDPWDEPAAPTAQTKPADAPAAETDPWDEPAAPHRPDQARRRTRRRGRPLGRAGQRHRQGCRLRGRAHAREARGCRCCLDGRCRPVGRASRHRHRRRHAETYGLLDRRRRPLGRARRHGHPRPGRHSSR